MTANGLHDGATQPVSGQPTHARPVPGTTGSSAGEAVPAPVSATNPKRPAKGPRVCGVSGCGRPFYAKGACRPHYLLAKQRLRALQAPTLAPLPLVAWRIERGISQNRLAKLLGYSRSNLYQLENRRQGCGPKRRAHIAACLGATEQELFGGNPGAEPAPAARVTAAGGVSLTSGNRHPSSQPPPPRESDGGVTEAHNEISGRPA